jgi:D-inositol-3-phosphate glycosyltransferase
VRKGHVEALLVGDLASPRKGADVAVRAVKEDPRVDCRLTVVGGGSRLRELQQLAGGDRRIRFAGPLPPPDVHRLYAETDIFLFPTRADVFGLVLVEAMAAGLCVLTSAEPGAIADLVVDQRNGFVVRSHDPAAWAAVLRRAAENPNLSKALGVAATQTIRRRWTVDHAADAMLAGVRLGFLSRKRAM